MVSVITADIADRREQDRLAEEACAALGQIDILVNAAGASRPTTLDSADAVWDEALALNFDPIRRVTQHLLPACERAAGVGSSASAATWSSGSSTPPAPRKQRSTFGPRASPASWPRTASL